MVLITRRSLMASTILLPGGLLQIAEAQPTAKRVYRVGVLWADPSTEAEARPFIRSFIAGLQERGYVEGRNLVVEHRFPAEMPERFAMTADLISLRPDVLVGVTPPTALALKTATDTVPIVFTAVSDPLAVGLVTSLARPGGNATGFSGATPVAKQLQLLTETIPGLKRVGVLHHSANPADKSLMSLLDEAARVLGVTLRYVDLRSVSDVEARFLLFVRERLRAIVVAPSPLLYAVREPIARLALAARIATVYNYRQGPDVGGLFSYGVDLRDLFRRTAGHVARILDGAKPADLPIEQPTKFELVINLKTAKALGLTIPQTILLQADQVIE
jgi:putative tryptophan/tyrosine transport system substrate-binding protein